MENCGSFGTFVFLLNVELMCRVVKVVGGCFVHFCKCGSRSYFELMFPKAVFHCRTSWSCSKQEVGNALSPRVFAAQLWPWAHV